MARLAQAPRPKLRVRRQPVVLARARVGAPTRGVAGLTRRRDDAMFPSMNVEPKHPLLPPEGMTDEEFDALQDARAEADIAAGRLVPHAEVTAWARKLGTPDEAPMPREWLE